MEAHETGFQSEVEWLLKRAKHYWESPRRNMDRAAAQRGISGVIDDEQRFMPWNPRGGFFEWWVP